MILMTQAVTNYAVVLYELGIAKEIILEADRILHTEPKLKQILGSPIVSKKKKNAIIEKVFPMELHSFLKTVCRFQAISEIEAIFDAYKKYEKQKNKILEAKLTYVTKPNEEQVEEIKTALKNKYQMKQVELSFEEDPELLGGFIIHTMDYELDWSIRGKLEQLQQKLVRR